MGDSKRFGSLNFWPKSWPIFGQKSGPKVGQKWAKSGQNEFLRQFLGFKNLYFLKKVGQPSFLPTFCPLFNFPKIVFFNVASLYF